MHEGETGRATALPANPARGKERKEKKEGMMNQPPKKTSGEVPVRFFKSPK